MGADLEVRYNILVADRACSGRVLLNIRYLLTNIHKFYKSLVVRKPVFGFSTRSYTNRAVRSKNMVRGL